jgi:hypothetical protein
MLTLQTYGGLPVAGGFGFYKYNCIHRSRFELLSTDAVLSRKFWSSQKKMFLCKASSMATFKVTLTPSHPKTYVGQGFVAVSGLQPAKMHVQVAILITIRLPKFGRNWRPGAKVMQVQPFFAPNFLFTQWQGKGSDKAHLCSTNRLYHSNL